MYKLKGMSCAFYRIDSLYEEGKNTTSGWIAENHLGFCRIIVPVMIEVSKMSSGDMEFVKEYEFMLLSWCCLISRLMTKETVNTMEIDIYVKVFLFLFRSFEEKAFHDTDGNFMWYNRPNVVSLLYLPN